MTTNQELIPVTLLTGFLGAGKTTLLNRILTEDHHQRYAVIINEFGEIGIDGDLVLASEEDLFEMNNGCICCTVRGDLIETLHRLLDRAETFDAVIIETTGLADPGPVAQTFFVDPKLQAHFKLDSITTLVDAKHLPQSLEQGPEAAEQIAFADHIIINKFDLVSGRELHEILRLISTLNPYAKQTIAKRANVDLKLILNQGRFDLSRLDTVFATNKNPAHGEVGHVHTADCDHHPRSTHTQDVLLGGISSCMVIHDAPLDGDKVSNWLIQFLSTHGQDVLRVKGIVNVASEDRKMVFHGVHMMVEGDFQKLWTEDEQRQTRMVWIGRNLDKHLLQNALRQCQVDI